MNLNQISAWSIRNPVVPIVLFTGLLLAGLLAFSRMEVNADPDIDFPAAIVTIAQPGAAPSELETQVTQLVEAAVQSIEGVDQISSTVTEGNSQTVIFFELGVDPNEAANDVKNAVDQIRGELPEGILEPVIQRLEGSGETIAYFAVDAKDMTMEQLSWFVDDTISKRLLSVEGVASVDRGGGVDREIRVTLDPVRMQALGVTAAQINDMLRQLNLNATGGQAEIAGSRQSVRVLGNAESAYALGQRQISLGNGRTIRLSEVATVTDSNSEQTSTSRLNGEAVVTFGIERARGASEVTIWHNALEEIAALEEEYPGVEITNVFTSVEYTEAQYESSMAALVEGAVLAVIVVFFFLRDWRATIISAIAIPLSAIPTFWFMDLLDFTLNQMSLLALALVAGVLVDDAIVEIENIVRHMRMGKTAYQAAIDAADEIGLAVVATTFSIVAVFLPVGLMGGISGLFFRVFGLTVVISVLMSLAVARMITPMVAAYFLKAKGQEKHAEGPLLDRYISLLTWTLDRGRPPAGGGGQAIQPRWHIRDLFRDHRVWTLGFGGLALMATVGMFFVLPIQTFPDLNEDFVRIRVEMTPGTTLEQTEEVSAQAAAIVTAQPEVRTAVERVTEGTALLFISLNKNRERTSIEFQRDLTPALQDIPDARVSFFGEEWGGPSSGRDISVMLSGSDPEVLNETAQQIVTEMSGVSGLVAPRVSADLNRPEILIRPRYDLAADLGVTTAALSQTIRIATQGEIDRNSAKFSLTERQIPIRVMLPEQSRESLTVLENLPVPTAGGGSVPLSRVADIEFGAGPTTIQREDQQRRVFIGADLAPDAVYGVAVNAIERLPTMRDLPMGVTNPPAGMQEIEEELITNMTGAVIAALFLVFGVLVLLYQRFISPLVNMGSLTLAPLGGLLLLWATGNVISMPVLIGILMLLGIVGKNSILLIDFALVEMERGVRRRDAIIDAGRKRAQPIVMTTVAMVAGMVPTALSLSGDGAFRAPMGVVVIGGLIMSTLLTLALVPAGFSLALSIEKLLGGFFRRHVLVEQKVPEASGSAPSSTGANVQPAE